MIAEHTKMLRQERKLPTVQTLSDKMTRLTNRRAQNTKLLLNELQSGDKEKNVTFAGNNNNHMPKATSSEGKDIHTINSNL